VSVCPCWGVPLIGGGDVLAGAIGGGGCVEGGAAWTTAVALDVAEAVPFLFEATTLKRNVEPTSAATGVYPVLVAPPMGEQLAPEELHRCHWYVNVTDGPLQVPGLPVNVWPTCGVPLTVGGAVFVGGD
jgi:hypothetical protein